MQQVQRAPDEVSEADEPGGLLVWLEDDSKEEYHLTAKPGYDSGMLDELLNRLESAGLVALDEDECPSETLDYGSVRIHFRREE